VLAVLVAAALANASAAQVPGGAPYGDEEWDSPSYDDEEHPARVRVAVWGGDALGEAGSGRTSTHVGGEAGWAFEHIDLGVLGSAYRNLADADREWTPVVLARLTQRFKMRRGVEAAFGFGLGAGRPKGWTAWYQLAIGVRVPVGPLFLAGELGFEQNDLLRLAGGLGFAFF
jgi:hypothetical protein